MVVVVREKLITVRIAEKTQEEFRMVADLRGASMSSLIHQFIVKAIREERQNEPNLFAAFDAKWDMPDNKAA